MLLKNKKQREEFLNNYRNWELWKEIPELDLKFYRYRLPNGTVIIATEYACMKFADYRNGHFEYEKSTSVRYHLILSEADKYKIEHSNTAYKYYNPSGDSISSIIQYLAETKPEVTL